LDAFDFFTAFATVLMGVVIFVVQNLILKLVIEPAKDLKKQIVETGSVTLFHMAKLSNATPSQEVADAIKAQSASIRPYSDLVMCYGLIRQFYKLPSKQAIKEACGNLNLIASNMSPSYQKHHKQSGGGDDLAMENNKLLRKTSELLGIGLTHDN
jgi:hypothetical protein